MWAEVLCGRHELAAVRFSPNSGSAMGAAVAVGVAEVQTGLRGVVQFVGRHVVAHQVAAVVGEPEFAGGRVPVKPTVLRTPRAKVCSSLPSRRMRRMAA